MPSNYYATNSNGYGYDNTASVDDPVAYEGESHLSSTYNSEGSEGEIYDEDLEEARYSTPLPSLRTPNPHLTVNSAPPTSEHDIDISSPRIAPYSSNADNEEYQLGYGHGRAYNPYSQGYEEGVAAAKREMDPENSSTGPTEPHSTQGYGYSSMLLAEPARDGTTASTDPPEGTAVRFQNQFAPVNQNAGTTFDDSYAHGGLPMKSGHLGGHGLSKTGIAAGAGSGGMGKGVGRQPGLASVNARTGSMGLGSIGGGGVARGTGNIGPGYGGGISGMNKASHLGGSAGHGNKPGTGGWKGAGMRLLRNAGKKSEKNSTVGETGRKYY